MDKVLKALKSLLPESDVKEVADALTEILDESKAELTKEFEAKLEDAYTQHTEELGSAEKTAEEGYQQAYAIIEKLRNDMQTQKEEFDQALEDGYSEALAEVKKEEGKNKNLEVEVYEEYEKKLAEMRDYIVDKVDVFLQTKGSEIYEQAKRDMLNDPRMVEHKVALDRILEVAQDYISDEDYAMATSSRLDQAVNEIENLKGKIHVLEAKNVNLGNQKNKLEEQVRSKTQELELLNEQTQKKVEKTEKKERIEKAVAAQASGKGKKVTEEQIIAEHNEAPVTNDDESETFAEEYAELQALAGLSN